MGKLSRTVIGAVVLPLAFLPTAAWSATDPTAPAAASSTASPTDPVTTPPTGEPTKDPTAAPTADPTADPDNPFESIGQIAVTPLSGPAGTSVKVSSITKCVSTKGTVGTHVFVDLVDISVFQNTEKDGVVNQAIVKPAKDGSWTAKLTTPKSAKSGTTYGVLAYCIGVGATGTDPELIMLYVNDENDYDFIVTDAPKAPVAKPVTKAPSFTG